MNGKRNLSINNQNKNSYRYKGWEGVVLSHHYIKQEKKMNIDELRKSVDYLRDLIGIEPPRKEESKEEIEESLLSLLQIDPNSYSDRILGGDEVEFDYELKKAKRLAKDIKLEREGGETIEPIEHTPFDPEEWDSFMKEILSENKNPTYENESPIYQELKEIKERIEVLMEKL